jgi:Rhodopirellula transposase DDE domain
MRVPEDVLDQLALRFEVVLPHLNERQRRLLLAQEARLLGHGGVRAVAQVAGVSETTVRAGVFELEDGTGPFPAGRVRREGGGRKSAEEFDPGLVPALLALVEPDERGDPQSPLRWTVKSLRALAVELTGRGHPVSAPTVGRLLREAGFSLQANVKTLEGKQHPDRDAQFRYINERVKEHQAEGQPVISVDAKKKEYIGRLPSPGRVWRPKADPVRVEDHSFYFMGPEANAVIPYGIYDLARDTGWVNVGVDHDTSAFAVESIRRWWRSRGQLDYPLAARLLITADSGGSNSYRYRLWKTELAAFAAETGLSITVCHFPPGTSKWNKIEHRLFSHISMNWRGRPLSSHEIVVNSIAATTTRTGLTVHAELDPGSYPVGIAVSREQVRRLPITAHAVRGAWNYTVAAHGTLPAAPATDRDRDRSQILAMLADPRLTGMSRGHLGALVNDLAPLRAAQAEARKYQQRGGPRRKAKGEHCKALLSDADRILITVLYLRQVCSQQVLIDLLGVSAVGKAIAETRALLHAQKITIDQTTLRFRQPQELRDLLGEGRTAREEQPRCSELLTHPSLTGMSRDEFQALLTRLHVPYAAAIEQRRHRRRGGDKLPGTRGGVFLQRISDHDRILSSVLSQRKVCSLETLAELFAVSRGTICNAMDDVLPLLDRDGLEPTPADQRFASAAAVLDFVAANPETPA